MTDKTVTYGTVTDETVNTGTVTDWKRRAVTHGTTDAGTINDYNVKTKEKSIIPKIFITALHKKYLLITDRSNDLRDLSAFHLGLDPEIISNTFKTCDSKP